MNFESIKFVIETLVSVGLTASAIYISITIHKSEKSDSKTSKTISCLTDLFSEYKETMKKINPALEVLKDFENYLEECKCRGDFSDFNKEYYSEKYAPIRDVHYFFELLGAMVRQEEIGIYTVWHYFSFPIEYFIKTKNIRNIIREYNCLPSYGENFCRLFVLYDNARKKSNKRWIANGKDFTLSEDQVEYYSDGYPYEKVEENTLFSKKKSKKEKNNAITAYNETTGKVKFSNFRQE